MQTIVLSRKEAENFISNQPYIVISISDVLEQPANLPITEHTKAILRLYFDDVDSGDGKISDRDAFDIAEFMDVSLRRHGSDIFVLVHCHAGISRSAGVAAAIEKFFNDDDTYYFSKNRYCPNRLVYRKTLEAFQDMYNNDIYPK